MARTLNKVCALRPAREAAEERLPLRVLADVFAHRRTGVVVHVRQLGAGPRTLTVGDGGVVGGVEALDAALDSRWARFSPEPQPPGDRVLLGRRLAQEALRGGLAPGRLAPGHHLRLSVALPLAEELGLYPDLRWEVSGLALVHDLDPATRLAVQVRAIEALGWGQATGDPAPAAPSPRAAPGGATEDTEDQDTEPTEVTAFALVGLPEDTTTDLRPVRALMAGGHLADAEQELLRLRDRRVDDPVVLAHLAWVKAADLGRLTHERLEEAERWAQLAGALGAGQPEVDAALAAYRGAATRLGPFADVAGALAS